MAVFPLNCFENFNQYKDKPYYSAFSNDHVLYLPKLKLFVEIFSIEKKKKKKNRP